MQIKILKVSPKFIWISSLLGSMYFKTGFRICDFDNLTSNLSIIIFYSEILLILISKNRSEFSK